ncbi:unnamed protein product [Schistosoma turkestanicum]|nr:unnamed protein product [Schistosoma turkestanicum]
MAGLIILVGQAVDGLMTPIIGLLSDRYSSQPSAPLLIPSLSSSSSSSSQSLSTTSSPSSVEAVTHNTVNHRLLNSNEYLKNHHKNYMSTYSSDNNTTDSNNDNNNNNNLSFRQRFKWIFKKLQPYGRKIWHLVGSILIIFSFPLIFGPPLGSSNASTLAKMIYYLPLVAIFQTGWAAVQITHLAMINELTMESSERTFLTSLRYLFTVLSNLLVYISTFFLLQHQHSDNNNTHNDTIHNNSMNGMLSLENMYNYNEIQYFMLPMVMTSHPLSKCSNQSLASPSVIDFGKDDIPAFQKLGFTIISVGGLTMLLFHFGAYLTIYLLHSLRLPKITMASVPLTVYLTSIATTIVQKPIQDRISRELSWQSSSSISYIHCRWFTWNWLYYPTDYIFSNGIRFNSKKSTTWCICLWLYVIY